MSKLSNVLQTKKAKEKYNHPIVDILLERHTGEDLEQILHCSNRKVREVIAECSMHYPIIAISEKASGYRRAKDLNNLTGDELIKEMAIVRRTISEHSSRVKCLKKKMKPLIAWLKIAEKKRLQEEQDNARH